MCIATTFSSHTFVENVFICHDVMAWHRTASHSIEYHFRASHSGAVAVIVESMRLDNLWKLSAWFIFETLGTDYSFIYTVSEWTCYLQYNFPWCFFKREQKKYRINAIENQLNENDRVRRRKFVKINWNKHRNIRWNWNQNWNEWSGADLFRCENENKQPKIYEI